MTMTSHLPLSAVQLKLLCLWMMPIINAEKLDDEPPVDEAKVLAGLQRIMRKAPTFDDLKTATATKVVSAFERLKVDLPDGVADVITQFLQRWEPTGLHCNQVDCGLPALYARGNVLDEKKHGERCSHCKRGTVEGSQVHLTIFDWINGKEVPKDVMSISSGPQEYMIQPNDLEGLTAPAILAILREKGLDVSYLLYWLLKGRHDLSIHRTPRDVLAAIGPQGYLVSNLDSIAVAAYIDTAKSFKPAAGKTEETGGGSAPAAFAIIPGFNRFVILSRAAAKVLAEAYPNESTARAAIKASGFPRVNGLPFDGSGGAFNMWSHLVDRLSADSAEALLRNAMEEAPDAGDYAQFRSDPAITWVTVQRRLTYDLSPTVFDKVRDSVMYGTSWYKIISYPHEATQDVRAAELVGWCMEQTNIPPQAVNYIINAIIKRGW